MSELKEEEEKKEGQGRRREGEEGKVRECMYVRVVILEGMKDRGM